MNPVAIGLDIGTSGLKAVAIRPDGQVVAESHASYELLTPKPGWTEQRPEDWLLAARSTLKELAGLLKEKNCLPVAIGLTGQMHGAVFLDNQGSVIRPALLWNDQRTGDASDEINRVVGRAEMIARTGNPAITGFQLPKILWLRQNEPGNFARLTHVLLPKDFLGFALSGNMSTEPSDASGVGCLNLARKEWDTDILAALKLKPELFPKIVASHAVTGRLQKTWSDETGLPFGLPIVAGGGDNAAAAIGLGLSSARPGLGSLSLGTSGVIFLPLESATPEPNGRVHLFCHADGGYHLLGVTLAAAGSLQWMHDKLAPNLAFEDLMAEAENVQAGSDGLVFLPYLSGERSPHLDPNLRAAWIGLSLAHTRAHMTRALLEGVAMSLRDTLDVMQPILRPTRLLAIGGGARSSLWCDIVGASLEVQLAEPEFEEGPSHGAAILALVGAGVHASVQDALIATAPKFADRASKPEAEYANVLKRYRSGFRAVSGR